jgi:hypothetical protein
MAHLEDAAASLADYRESFYQNFIESFLHPRGALILKLLQAVGVGAGFVSKVSQTDLDALPEFVGLGAQLLVREPLHLLLKGVYSLDLRHQTLQFALVFGPEDLA